jgi:hypothetical protein
LTDEPVDELVIGAGQLQEGGQRDAESLVDVADASG